MHKDVINPYLNKPVKLSLKNGAYFSGRLLIVSDNFLIVDDPRCGRTTIDLSALSSVASSEEVHP